MTADAQRLADRSINKLTLLLIFLAFSLRLAFGFAQLSKPLNDPDRYIPFAKSLWAGDGFIYNGRPTAYRPPLYPLILAPLAGILGEAAPFRIALILVQSAMGAATTLLAIKTAEKIAIKSHNPIVSGYIAGIFTAFDPVLLSQAAQPMTETLAALLLTASLARFSQDRYFSAGFLSGLGALCRPSLLACTTLIILAILWSCRNSIKIGLHRITAVSIPLLIVIAPWAVRNYYAIGWPVFTTTHGGYTFALANNPVYYDEVLHGPAGAVWSGARQQAWFDSIGPSVKGLSEHDMDQSLKSRTWAFVREHPVDFFRATIQRQLHFWSIAPSGQVYGPIVRYTCIVWTLPFWVLAATGLFSRQCKSLPGLAALAVIAGLAGVHLIYWTDIRMRAPIIPALAIVAGQSWFVSEICNRLSQLSRNDVNKL
jgi:Gpi18-like mannosyltransferase